MKIIKIIFFSLLALSLIICTGVYIFFETFDTDQYLPQITKKASLALGRQVSIGQLGLGLSSRGITLDAWPLTVADDAGFTTQPFIRIDRVRISLDLKPLVLQREVHITGILLQSPQIHFIRSQEGNFNFQSYVIASPKGKAITEGIIDSPVIASVAKQSLDDNRGQRPIIPSLNINSIKIQDGSISFIDQNQTVPLDIWLTNINANINDFSLSQPFRLSFDASLYSNDPNMQGSALMFLDLSKRSLQVSDLSLHSDLTQLDIERLKGISPEMADSPLLNTTGVAQLNLAHLGIGTSGDIETNGDLIITGVVIKDFNIIQTVLTPLLKIFEGMGAHVDNIFNGPLKDKLNARDTVIENAQAKFSYHDKAVSINDSLIKTNIFELTARGSVDQGLNLDMQTLLHLNKDVSAALVNEFEGMKLLEDDSDRIAIDASLQGVMPHLKYKPNKDFRKKTRRMLIEEGGNILGALFGSGQTSTADQEATAQDSVKKPKKSFKNILKSLLP